jgi:transcriptional regulator with XRE-family HTH domain
MSNLQKKLGKKIKKIRIIKGLTQQDLANKLGIKRVTLSQMENGERRVTVLDLVKLSKIFNLPIDNFLGLSKEPEIILDEISNRKKPLSTLRINVPQKNLEKFREVILYILNEVGSKPNIGETVIYKLLYFIDFDFYEKYEEQLIGATYIKNNYGPTPVEFKKIIEHMIKRKELTKVINNYFKYPQTKYLPLRKPDKTKLKAIEIELIDDVLNRLSDMNASQISEYSHNDIPWLTTENQDVIEYESVFYRTPFYSMRRYEEDIQED